MSPRAASPNMTGTWRRWCGIAVCTAAALAMVRAAAAQADRGETAFSRSGCATCHGPAAKGGLGPALVPMAQAYPQFARIVREGVGEMPPFSARQVPDDQLEAIHAYLKAQSAKNDEDAARSD